VRNIALFLFTNSRSLGTNSVIASRRQWWRCSFVTLIREHVLIRFIVEEADSQQLVEPNIVRIWTVNWRRAEILTLDALLVQKVSGGQSQDAFFTKTFSWNSIISSWIFETSTLTWVLLPSKILRNLLDKWGLRMNFWNCFLKQNLQSVH